MKNKCNENTIVFILMLGRYWIKGTSGQKIEFSLAYFHPTTSQKCPGNILEGNS